MSSTGMNLVFDLPPRRELPADRRDAMRRLLEDAVAGRPRARVLPAPRLPRVRPALLPVAGLATASAVAAAVLVVGDLGSDGADTAHAATPPVLAAELAMGQPAGAELRSLAAQTQTQIDTTAAADTTVTTVTTESWLLTVTETGAADGGQPAEGRAPVEGAAAGLSQGAPAVTSAVVPVLREQRFLADGSVHVRETQGEPRFPTEEWSEADDAATPGAVLLDETIPAGGLASGYPERLATDPAALREQLLAVWPQADDTAAALFQALHEVASTRVVDASIQAAALTMLAQEPGVVALGETTDRRGRAAVAFGTDSDDTGLDRRHVLMVDPGTGRLLGYEEVLTRDTGGLDVDAPVVTTYTVFL
ncbi:hypothetical protein E1262_28615 [Jiangella aurantiaca]|uniref:CU044_5270 family protein n=1 Tax=Jiangella aurantiaca TaxID=2530373 RepID=A0A4V2YR16_9ACTN|nr:hypothetical protein [Jiangella aurantiaca]TDD64317.1 hypothetical protein E1262_28615 [Jiangella aurantiaca]